ncbi:FAD-dependent monooxygenase [Mycobacteroides franklinii]|uniref:6-hydroxynicotinate 3-monooxygenase n=1 Tax=Mycobacteroides franklinii TaxID=948102 RepID=A0A4R8REH9_9MYCO|nr:FAD-dependent monooxygenase [Mycobacteroides franklinii]TDZ46225.1 6-hydroxynicotinate 3-monooxygenase precursor [Mycobacteroides franklinii]TDZ53268.1 6-hydroxynicotinate 3-monooxygenase precursor [Mycobacteroides franklinii]TDZ59942.1 6-hydroxynicotinate 3-monooxygenase precursor [Mycobacteroides franklinii]TDZ65341.1 6-hydroxynicotinate 3-monooxygenase precursor [Mycobacteroides franklinii]TDZ73511.1 6-hydroxynicotinate 3-monooxygenase precursor [Mycobacteroides franklinii]
MSLNILISGGGIAGPALAYWLAREGHSVTIVERARALRSGGQAVDFRGPSVEVLDKMGVLHAVRAQATHMGSLVMVDAGGNEIARLPPEVISGELEILWGDLARILHDAVRDHVTFRFGDWITDVRDDGAEVAVSFAGAAPESFDLVIGADGVHSGLRVLTFGPENEFVTQLGQYFTFFAMDNHLGLDHQTVSFREGTRGVSIQVNAPDAPARGSLAFSDDDVKFDYRDIEGNKRLFRERFTGFGWETAAVLDALSATDEPYFDSLCQVHLNEYSRGRVCLIGDAAWCASPRSGMGTSLAIVGAYVLAHELRSAQGDFPTAFTRFHALMVPYVARCQQLALSTLKIDGATSPWAKQLRKLGLWSLRLPGVRQLVALQALKVGRSFVLPTYD